MTDNSSLYRMLGDNCEQCGKPIAGAFVRIWVEDNNPCGERPALFCDDVCLEKWWKEPVEETDTLIYIVINEDGFVAVFSTQEKATTFVNEKTIPDWNEFEIKIEYLDRPRGHNKY